MPSLFRALLIALALVSVTACTSKPLMNPGRSLPTTLHPNDEQMKHAILTTLVKRKWEVQRIDPGLIQAQITVRGEFHAEIDIPYTLDFYQIKYRDSRGLDYKDGKIHKNYNRWVRLLDKGILRELRDDQANTTARNIAGGVTPQGVPQTVQ
ncbi:hypothetical protein [Pseudomonas sp. Pseu.R1]|uniref:hypothetical protein n=1 Tax=Pseudomonas sp. Pseu.R1 TaxID=3379818 RepID=UPI003B94E7F5